MSTNIEDINKYRKTHHRCRTCEHASGSGWGWNCTAKQKRHTGNLCDTMIAGCFCKLYSPKLQTVSRW